MSFEVTPRRILSFLALPVLALSLAACGGSSRSAGTVPAEADIVVRAKDGLVWDAKSYTASSADGPVLLYGVSDSGLAHNLHVVDADDNDVADNIDLPGSGSSGTITLDLTPGEYRIICKIPGHSGTMNATLTIS
ncbi:MAG: hypothetical protein Q7V57_12365 [Actinomycetota bacterium]|nr:hypothetical protein [Actinomycetota bacterium]